MTLQTLPDLHDSLGTVLARAAGLLPDQGPIGVFIHHNTLHALQHLPFHEAVVEGARLVGARPYLSVTEFRAAWDAGRIEPVDLDEALSRSLGTEAERPSALGLTLGAFRRLVMLHDPEVPDLAGVSFRARVANDDGRELAHLAACREAVRRGPRWATTPREISRHHDAFAVLGQGGTDAPVHRELIRLCAGFLDQGQAAKAMPGRERGFLNAVASLYAAVATEPRLARGIARDFAVIHAQGTSARQVIEDCLAALGVDAADQDAFLLSTLLALPGWTGMFSRLERHPDEAEATAPARLEDVLAVRLIIERRAIEAAAKSLGVPVKLRELRLAVPLAQTEPEAHVAVRLHELTRACGWGTERIAALATNDLRIFQDALAAFPDIARRATWHEAYEGWYRRHVLNAVGARRALGSRQRPDRPDAQFVFCIDEREESIRRAIEELGPGLETFGGAGFFGIAVDLKGLYDAEPAAHCPVVVVPDHEVHEAPLYTAAGWHAARTRLRNTWHAMHRGAHRGSRTLVGGLLLSLTLGPLSAAVAFLRVLFPRMSLGTFLRVRDRFLPRPATRLASVRATHDERTVRGKLPGFSLDESADRVAATLRSIGLTKSFAPMIVVLGHGSTSLNNPHESAHDCGACGGRRGGQNARLFADMANRPVVRDAVRARGIEIPSDTWFVGALHDTADDGVDYYDLELLPRERYPDFERADLVLQNARERSAQERCRRFEPARLDLSPEAALDHVELRASHLGQPRPEYGHCTNAAAFVGRRELTRGIHFDRRAFLISYDPSIDPDAAILERVLAAVGPVGAGISLEYFFSSVDNEVYGCGTKLPHNVTGLVGVMNGHHSDLRTGLPLQMVEIHEPMRLLLVVEATPEALLQVAQRQPEVRELVVNAWVQLVSLDPATGAMAIFRDGCFEPYTPDTSAVPRVDHSIEWHGRVRTHVSPALVAAGIGQALGPSPVALRA